MRKNKNKPDVVCNENYLSGNINVKNNLLSNKSS